jgi:hypothetical protein
MSVSRTLFILLLLASAALAYGQDDWSTTYDRSGGTRTPRYDETVAFCKRLAAASPYARYTTFGMSPQGRSLPLLIISKNKAFTPAAAARTAQAVVLIQAGIHSGEIDGKDAGFSILRDMLVRKHDAGMLDSVIILFVPIFNVDGHERFSAYNRINQNGPAEMGWRTTARNLNLNRDYMKADTPEMRAMLGLFQRWLPDLYIDCHVTDGIDMQYDITYATELGPNIDARIAAYLKDVLMPPVLADVEHDGHPIFWYVFPREETDLSKGMGGGASTPRFSTGYAALQNRPSILIETHMLKPYRTRVEATISFLRSTLHTVARSASQLRRVVREADRRRIAMETRTVPLKFDLGKDSTLLPFKGIRFRKEQSELSGTTRLVYTGEPYEVTVPFFDQILTTASVGLPAAWIIPPEWGFVPEVLRLHGVRFQRTAVAETITVSSTQFTNVHFGARPYEGRQIPTYTTTALNRRCTFPSGSIIVPAGQRASHVAAHLLEPRSGDSFVAWGFFNAIFEQKEYAEDYVMEKEGKTMLEADPALRTEFFAKVNADTAFAHDPSARLNWLYLHSRWTDETMNIYPVGRVDEGTLRRIHIAQ